MHLDEIRWDEVRRSPLLYTVLGVLLATALLGIAAFAYFSYTPRYSTPHNVWEAQKEAVSKKDWRKLYSTFTPDSQNALLAGAAIGGQRMMMSVPAAAEVLKKHRVNLSAIDSAPHSPADSKAAKEARKSLEKSIADSIRDKPAFYAEMMTILWNVNESRCAESGQGEPLLPTSLALKDVVIEGDQAQGLQVIISRGERREVPIQFRHIGGGWLIHSTLRVRDKAAD